MKLAMSAMVSTIDAYCRDELGIPTSVLMKKSGDAVAAVIKERAPKNKHVVILAGKGNNGGDGYAAAAELLGEYDVVIYDVFSAGQKTDEGREFLKLYESRGGKIINFEPTEQILSHIKSAGCIVDAIFGTGFQGEMPEQLRPLAVTIREAVEAQKIAIDVPLGINADNGSVSDFAISVGATVELSFIKPGIISYPARSFVGRIIHDDLGLPRKKITGAFDFKYHMVDSEWVEHHFKLRENNSNKGTFGKLLVITGSERYRGAAHLSLDAALRGGVGLVTYLGTPSLISELSQKYPEAIYKSVGSVSEIIDASSRHTVTLIGSGSDNTDELLSLTLSLLSAEGGPLILDADAINALASLGDEGPRVIKNAKRTVVLTPHPLEFARLSGTSVAAVQQHRLEAAVKFAKENRCILILKGAGTVITDGNEVYINAVGSSALAKAGSGDVLAGYMASMIAQNTAEILHSAALSVYFHALAGESLAEEFSSYGVIPSDLSLEIARQMAKTEKELKGRI